MNKIEEVLRAYQHSYFGNKFVIKFNNKVVFFGGVNVFKSEGIAKRCILNHAFGKNSNASSAKGNKELLEEMISKNIVSIEKIDQSNSEEFLNSFVKKLNLVRMIEHEDDREEEYRGVTTEDIHQFLFNEL